MTRPGLAVAVVAVVLALAPVAHAKSEPCCGSGQYVTDTMTFGRTVAEADSYAFDLDNDSRHVPDDALGHVLAGLSSQIDVNSAIASSLKTGAVVILHSLRTAAQKGDNAAAWQVYLGAPKPNPVLTGGGRFAVDSAASAGTQLVGKLTSGQFAGGPGIVPLRLVLVPGAPPIELHLAGARIQADCNAARCINGKLGGGIAPSELNAVVIPALAAAIQTLIDTSCTGPTPDTCSVAAQQMLNLFDANGDLRVTADELRANALIQAVLQPDVDLFKADGTPGRDGVKDSVSVALGFTARNASFKVAAGSAPRAFNADLDETFDDLTTVSTGTGNATGIGRASFQSSDVAFDAFDFPASFFISGSGSLSRRAPGTGDTLFVSYGTTLTDVTSPPQGNNYLLSGAFVIDGGTGAFATASGSGTITGSCTSSFTSDITQCTEHWTGAIGSG